MKKTLIILIFLIPIQLLTMSFVGPYQEPTIQKRNFQKKMPPLFFDAGMSFSWWHCPKHIMLDVSSNKDFIDNSISKVVPGCYGSLSTRLYAFRTHPIKIYTGIRGTYGQRKNSIRTDYFKEGDTEALLETHHSLKHIRLSPFLN